MQPAGRAPGSPPRPTANGKERASPPWRDAAAAPSASTPDLPIHGLPAVPPPPPPPAPAAPAPAHDAYGPVSPHAPEMLFPTEQFGIVEAGVYRSSTPFPSHFPFFITLQLRRVIFLSPEAPTRLVTTFFTSHGVEIVHLGIGLPGWATAGGSWKPMSEEVVKDALEMVLDASVHPVCVCDTSGVHQVGVLVACLRRLQGWALNSTLMEYQSYAGGKARYGNEQFIELFDESLVTLPRVLPEWYLTGVAKVAAEREELSRLIESGRVDAKQERVDGVVAGLKPFEVFWYSEDAPLSSEKGRAQMGLGGEVAVLEEPLRETETEL